MTSITSTPVWDDQELAGLKASYDLGGGVGDALTKYNPAPGAGCEGAGQKAVGHPPAQRWCCCRRRPLECVTH